MTTESSRAQDTQREAERQLAASPFLDESRKLTKGETEFLKTVFYNEVDYSVVRIRKGLILTIQAEGVTLDNLISFSKDAYLDDFSAGPYINDIALLTHEAGHVWQYQKKIKDYWWMKALLEHIRHGDNVYNYDIDEHKTLAEYRFEQMGQILYDYIVARASHSPNLTKYESVIYATIPRAG